MLSFVGFNLVFLLMGYVELRRKVFFMRGAFQMMTPGQHVLANHQGLVGLIPTANIFDARTLAAWYELRVTLL